MKRRSKSLFVFGAFAIGLVALLYVALTFDVFRNKDKELTTLSPKGPTAASIQTLNIWVFSVAAVVFVLVFATGFYIMWRFRDHGEDADDADDFPEQVHGRFALEIGWTIVPLLLLGGRRRRHRHRHHRPEQVRLRCVAGEGRGPTMVVALPVRPRQRRQLRRAQRPHDGHGARRARLGARSTCTSRPTM